VLLIQVNRQIEILLVLPVVVLVFAAEDQGMFLQSLGGLDFSPPPGAAELVFVDYDEGIRGW
jgi:hypothetical protein